MMSCLSVLEVLTDFPSDSEISQITRFPNSNLVI